MTTLFGDVDKIERDAAISVCGRYRYSLSRCWDRSMRLPWVCWLMLNPSIADANVDDPTIVRCMGFSRAWGFGGMTVRNLFALRATDPAELLAAADPIGPENDKSILTLIGGGLVVAAWGAHGSLLGRDQHVLNLFERYRERLWCLGTTKDGHPRHPLYLPKGLRPVEFIRRAA